MLWYIIPAGHKHPGTFKVWLCLLSYESVHCGEDVWTRGIYFIGYFPSRSRVMVCPERGNKVAVVVGGGKENWSEEVCDSVEWQHSIAGHLQFVTILSTAFLLFMTYGKVGYVCTTKCEVARNGDKAGPGIQSRRKNIAVGVVQLNERKIVPIWNFYMYLLL